MRRQQYSDGEAEVRQSQSDCADATVTPVMESDLRYLKALTDEGEGPYGYAWE